MKCKPSYCPLCGELAVGTFYLAPFVGEHDFVALCVAHRDELGGRTLISYKLSDTPSASRLRNILWRFRYQIPVAKVARLLNAPRSLVRALWKTGTREFEDYVRKNNIEYPNG